MGTMHGLDLFVRTLYSLLKAALGPRRHASRRNWSRKAIRPNVYAGEEYVTLSVAGA